MMAFTTEHYHIASHGNGWAFEITDQQTGESLWFQDQDAEQIRQETNNFEHEDIIRTYFECIGE